MIFWYLGRSEEEVCELEVTDNQACRVITVNQVKVWPKKGKLSAGQLSVKYAIGAANWVPTNHTSTVAFGLGKFIYDVGTKTMFDYGTYIFYQTVKHAATNAIKMPVAFPSMICGIILNQYPGILSSDDVACKRESILSLHGKLFAGKHVPDIVLVSAENKSSTKANFISELKKTCKDLDEIIHTSTERKLNIEKLIKSLEHANGTRISDAIEEELVEEDNSVENDVAHDSND
ncbi:uncharacterized protein LOC131648753 [Vicia villosa]|uniref:uncharacterized protein LOC131648753 n=1 Tax=Vicia villosa TaxID=3911 RepID=UPI00273B8EE6|nr:uncharacterized protein LOC131648753 [Vicia villosa]